MRYRAVFPVVYTVQFMFVSYHIRSQTLFHFYIMIIQQFYVMSDYVT